VATAAAAAAASDASSSEKDSHDDDGMIGLSCLSCELDNSESGICDFFLLGEK